MKKMQEKQENIEPFPINIEFEELIDFIMENKKDDEIEDIIDCLNNEDELKEAQILYSQIVEEFLTTNFQEGTYVVLQDALDVICELREKGKISNIFSEFNLDLSHLYGLTCEELRFVVIPMPDTETAFMLGEMVEPFLDISFLHNGDLIGHN